MNRTCNHSLTKAMRRTKVQDSSDESDMEDEKVSLDIDNLGGTFGSPPLTHSQPALVIGATAPQNPREYRPGSIMHISLRNFITYDCIDIKPGPYMNMVIGPNGTGKSSIVCAIALGLGENPSVMKRAKDISEFVKHGHRKGSIEITVAGRESGMQTKIRREITREGNKSVWKIDGKSATYTEVQRTCRELRIQVNNLCQFLPQDRVAEFSKMSPSNLLKQTQVAVGRDDLLKCQVELINQREQESKQTEEIKRLQHDTDTLRKQNDLLERDVRRWRERQEAEVQIRVLTALVPLTRYAMAKDHVKQVKETRKQAYAQYVEAKNATGPREEEMEELDARIADNENQRRQVQDQRREMERSARHDLGQLEKMEGKQTELYGELEDLKKRAEKRKQDIAKLREEISKLESQHAGHPPVVETQGLKKRMAEYTSQKLQLENDLYELDDKQQQLMRSGTRINGEVDSRHNQLRRLDDVAQRRRENLRKIHEATYKAMEWLGQNRDKFQQHVYDPICLEASVTDSRMTEMVETVIGVSTIRTFVTQCREDYIKFTGIVNDTMKLRVDVAYYPKDLSEFRAPQPKEALQRLGFEGYAMDFIDAPRPVLACMCVRDDVHRIPLALGQVNHQLIESKKLFQGYISDGIRYKISPGRYGSGASSVTTFRVRQQAGGALGSGETDDIREMRERYQEEIGEFRDQLAHNEREMKKLKAEETDVRDRHREVAGLEQECEQEKKRLTEEARRWQREKITIETKQTQLKHKLVEDRQDADSTMQTDKDRINRKLQDLIYKRYDLVQRMTEAVGKMTETVHQLTVIGTSGFSDICRLTELRHLVAKQRQEEEEAEARFQQMNKRYEEAKDTAKQYLAETKEITEELSEEESQAVRDEQARRAGATVEDLEIELSTCQQKLSMAANSGLSDRVMEQYEERKRELTTKVGSLQHLEHGLRKIQRRKQQLREQWEEPLSRIMDEISERFSGLFDQMGCLGEVVLRRAGEGDEDYDAWGAEIRVAFRKNEALQTLDNHRQSGGERAVSTILYLQSLQSLVAAPFRVVDEINQGMDEQNERLVHRLIVDTACQQGSAQYFLITPKLLPGLDYHPLMKVLCIFNGEWQPESFNFGKYISNARSR